MSVEFCGLTLAHPVINGSGTFDAIAARQVFGEQLRERFPFAAFVSKTITLAPRAGNPPPRLWETPAGLINSIGLPNKGLDGYLEQDLPRLAELGIGEGEEAVPLITNVMGASAEQLARLLEACDERAEIAAIELNVSCPNVDTGLDIGADPRQLEQVVRAVRGRTRKPLIVKLTPNTADVSACAQGAEQGGADALSLINTLRASAPAPSPSHRSRPSPRASRFRSSAWVACRAPRMRATCLTWEPRSWPSALRVSATRRPARGSRGSCSPIPTAQTHKPGTRRHKRHKNPCKLALIPSTSLDVSIPQLEVQVN
jgi:hypothetical protein